MIKVNDYRYKINKICDLAEQGNPLAQFILSDALGRLDTALNYSGQLSAIPLEVRTAEVERIGG